MRIIFWFFPKLSWDENVVKGCSVYCNHDGYTCSYAECNSQNEFLEMIKQSGLKITTLQAEYPCHSAMFTRVR